MNMNDYLTEDHQVAFFVNNSAPDVAYKNLSNPKWYKKDDTHYFRYKEPIDHLRPEIYVNKDSIHANWMKYNYAHINMFNRFYFMKYVAEEAGMLRYQLTVDPLSTYIDNLKGLQFEIERAAHTNKGDQLLFADPERPLQANKFVERYSSNLLLTLPEDSGGSYYLTVAGGVST